MIGRINRRGIRDGGAANENARRSGIAHIHLEAARGGGIGALTLTDVPRQGKQTLIDDAYNLIFEQPTWPLGTREFVVYNPRGKQTATSHAMDILQFTPERLERARGYYAVHDVPGTRWKYYWFE